MRAGLLGILAAVLLLGNPVALTAAAWPNDPAWRAEWGPVLTRTVELWSHGTGAPGVVVAVVDSGVAPVPDLEGALVPGVDLLGGGVSPGAGGMGYHGTWVATIIAARGNNGRDGAGYCWGCSIMPVRVSDGSDATDASLVAKGIRWAVDHGADIVNVSLAGRSPSADEAVAAAYARAHGVILVAAAGNSGDETRHYPGAYPSAVAVAGTDEHDRLYPWSSRGSWVPISAPGCAVVADPVMGAAYGCGSSFAPAAVAGIAGLLLSFDPSLSADRVVAALRSSAHAVDGIGGGRVDAAAAFAALALPDATNVPPSAPREAAPAAAAPREVTTSQGSVERTRTVSFGTGQGRVRIRFTTSPGVACQLLMRSGRNAVAALTKRGTATIEETVPAGAKRLVITCASGGRVVYTLEIERPVPAG